MAELGREDSFFAKDSDPLWHSMLMGTFSGATCVLVGHPLDTVKVRLQTSAKGQTLHTAPRCLRGRLGGLVSAVRGCRLPDNDSDSTSHRRVSELDSHA